MSLEMFAQMVFATEALFANIAGMLLVARMYGLNVTPEVRLVMELLRADITFVSFVSGFVLTQVGNIDLFGLIAFAALLTTKWILTGMETFVVLRQVADFGEFLVTGYAFDTTTGHHGYILRSGRTSAGIALTLCGRDDLGFLTLRSHMLLRLLLCRQFVVINFCLLRDQILCIRIGVIVVEEILSHRIFEGLQIHGVTGIGR